MTPRLFSSTLCVKEPRQSVSDLAAAPSDVPFSAAARDFCAELSRELFRADGKGRPEIRALAYWCRPAEVARLKAGFEELSTEGTRIAPRGAVFHVPPVNVETLFLYGWILSILCGNRNVVRISSRASQLTCELCSMVLSLLERYEALSPINLAVQYHHDDELTAFLSASCDLRIVWGGDESVRALRAVPLPPAARDICFPDRFSYSVIHSGAYLDCSEDQSKALAHAFYNDCFWFDQMACSSPRLIAWCGAPEERAGARKKFYGQLAREIERRKYILEPGARNEKLLFASRLILDESVESYESYGAELVVLQVSPSAAIERAHCGGGLLLSLDIPELASLAAMVRRRDQTLTYFGFDRRQMDSFANTLNGKGLDRIVPIGEALTFNRFWDGYDLLQELTRRVWVE